MPGIILEPAGIAIVAQMGSDSIPLPLFFFYFGAAGNQADRVINANKMQLE
jgi:hypothetical protein